MNQKANTSSILDVIDNFDHGTGMTPGRAKIVPMAKLEAFGAEVIEYWSQWESPAESGLRVNGSSRFDGEFQGRPAIGTLLASLLYYPSAIVVDPLADLFDVYRPKLNQLPRRGILGPQPFNVPFWPDVTDYGAGFQSFWSKFRSDQERRLGLSQMLRSYEAVRPLIRSGALIPVPAWKLVLSEQEAIAAAIRRDVDDDEFYEHDFTDGVRIGDFVFADPTSGKLSNATPRQLRELRMIPPSFYLNKQIVLSNATSSRYVPTHRGDYNLFKLRMEQVNIGAETAIESHVIPELASLELPEFSNLDADTLVKIREDHEAFFEFRLMLDEIFVNALSLPADASLPNQVGTYISDQLEGRLNEVRRATSKSRTLGEAASEARQNLIFGLAASSAAPLLASAVEPIGLAGGLIIATGSAAQGIAAMIHKMVARPELDGYKLVLSGLIEPRP